MLMRDGSVSPANTMVVFMDPEKLNAECQTSAYFSR